jgi:hypothetical protein
VRAPELLDGLDVHAQQPVVVSVGGQIEGVLVGVYLVAADTGLGRVVVLAREDTLGLEQLGDAAHGAPARAEAREAPAGVGRDAHATRLGPGPAGLSSSTAVG